MFYLGDMLGRGYQAHVLVYLDGGYSLDVPAANLRFSGEGINLQEDVVTAGARIEQTQTKTGVYRLRLADELRMLGHQIDLADPRVAQTMGYGINEPNDSVAQGLAQDVAAGILSESVVAFQGQAHLVGDRVAWLFNTPLRSPRFMN